MTEITEKMVQAAKRQIARFHACMGDDGPCQPGCHCEEISRAALLAAKEAEGEDTSGTRCVLCDFGLAPTEMKHNKFHNMPDGRFIECPIKDTPPMSDRQKEVMPPETPIPGRNNSTPDTPPPPDNVENGAVGAQDPLCLLASLIALGPSHDRSVERDLECSIKVLLKQIETLTKERDEFSSELERVRSGLDIAFARAEHAEAKRDVLSRQLADKQREIEAIRGIGLNKIAKAICQSATCEGFSCCQWPANLGRTKCPVDVGAYDDAAKAVLALLHPSAKD